jgi:hypothetical protein
VFLYAVELCVDRGRIMTDNGLWLTLKVFPGAKKGKIFADSVDLISTTYYIVHLANVQRKNRKDCMLVKFFSSFCCLKVNQKKTSKFWVNKFICNNFNRELKVLIRNNHHLYTGCLKIIVFRVRGLVGTSCCKSKNV